VHIVDCMWQFISTVCLQLTWQLVRSAGENVQSMSDSPVNFDFIALLVGSIVPMIRWDFLVFWGLGACSVSYFQIHSNIIKYVKVSSWSVL